MDIQILEHKDIGFITHLQPPDWQDIIPAIDFYTNANFCFPIKVTIDHKIVGIGTAIIHNSTAWLAHIIVHPDNRNQGIGRLLTETLVKSLQSKSCDTIYLISTELGEPVYKKVGFETETEYLIFKETKTSETFATSDSIVPFCDDFKIQISNLDLQISGENRMIQLERHLSRGFIFLHKNAIEGFYLPTLGDGFIAAITDSAGQELMKLRLTTKENAAFPVDNAGATEFMYVNNFKEFKTAKRMRLGKKRFWQPANIYNRIGGNLG